jgi:5-methylcytosine-specific restriction enzyme A
LACRRFLSPWAETNDELSIVNVMHNRFTRRSKLGRSRISKQVRDEVFRRDDNTCQFCGNRLTPAKLTIDHLIPLSRGGLNEVTNFVACCGVCNEKKANVPLSEFAQSINIQIEDLPVHGDPVIDNKVLPIQIRLLRKRIFDKARKGEITITGKSAQNKLEKAYRREFWQTPDGQTLESEFPFLPGHVRVMIPEIQTIAKNEREYLLLIELAKSAGTRNLIGRALTGDIDVERRLDSIQISTNDMALRKRIMQAQDRFRKALRKRGISDE